MNNLRIGICSMISKPFNFQFWIDYHISIGVEYFFLRIEDSPELKDILENVTCNIYAEYDDNVDKKDNYWTIIDRQKILVDKSLQEAKKLKVDWLFHVDSDELIWSKYDSIKQFLTNIDKKWDNISINNYEAVYPSDDLQNPFLQTNKFKICKSGGCGSYIQGKSVARVDRSISNKGPHFFTGETYWSSPSEAVILHYESPTFEIWYKKFHITDRGNFTYYKLDETFLDGNFYKKSIEVVNNSSKDEAREFYNSCKVKPYYENSNLAKLFWTPFLSQKNSQWSK